MEALPDLKGTFDATLLARPASAREMRHATDVELWRVENMLLQRFTAALASQHIGETESCTLTFVRLTEEVFEPDGSLIVCSVVVRALAAVVARLHQGLAPCPCGSLAPAWMNRLFAERQAPITQLVQEWLLKFFSQYRARHPESPAETAAALIRQRPAERWTLERLADLVAVHPRALSADFRRVFNICVEKYVHIARLSDGLDALCDRAQKLEAVIVLLGYRSKKDFYRWVLAVLSSTPQELHRLSLDRREALRIRLLNQSLPIRLRSDQIGASAPAS